jgi:hypothetical protein
MFIAMILSGFLSTMNVWTDKYSDMQFSLNDLYMTLLMTGWMFLFMGLIDKQYNILLFGLILVIVNVWCIRTQFNITQSQYLLGMIPHHSMAVHMSKKLLEKNAKINDDIKELANNIIKSQEKEITYMKKNI